MPEGDTIHRIAARLGPRLVGKPLVRVTTQGLLRDLAGQTVTRVEAHGKHLAIELANGTVLRAHLGMYGRQQSLDRASGEARIARMSPGRVTLAIVTEDTVDLWLGARTIEISDRRAPMHGMAIAELGPDILGDMFDPSEAATRARASSTRMVAEILLDQHIAAGIGNVYKSEVLFACSVHPRTHVASLSIDELVRIYATARDLMVQNLGPGPRVTRERLAQDPPGDDRYFVYGRTGKPCRACGSTIECYRLGEPPRWTWSCVTCQRQPPARP
ncbi:MAG: DNA-formamidopyrimidine glycosylase family protein [Kofleriaceae bacterium]